MRRSVRVPYDKGEPGPGIGTRRGQAEARLRGAAVFFFVVLRAFDEVCFFAEDELLEA
ncbi:hypothetical protein G3M55_33995, partial [Streptomyces sp. SID8455]|nr:hypothetical protein [Streptomyces sp. SID8455]